MPAPHVSPEEAVDIFLAPGPYKIIANRFNVAASNVSNIKRRRTHAASTWLFVPQNTSAMLVVYAFMGRPW